jgi:hypothetical protein
VLIVPVLISLVYSSIVAAAESPPVTSATSDYPVPNHPALRDRFAFDFGGYFARTSTAARLDANTGVGVVVDFEDALGLDDQKFVFQGAFRWRFAKHWRLDVDQFRLNRRGTKVLQDSIDWGDQTFPVGAEVNTHFRISDLRTAVGYSFFRRPDKELGIGLGLHTTAILASLDSSGGQAEAADVTAPLPVINFYSMVALTDRWAMSMKVDWLSLSYGDYSGDVRLIALDVLYQPFRHIGFGFGFHNQLYDLEVESTDWRGTVRMQFQGPSAFMTVSF